MDVYELQKEAWQLAEDKGFHENTTSAGRKDTLLRLCLVHTEVSEAAQEVKRGWSDCIGPTYEQISSFGEEMADAVIRILDLCHSVGVNLESHIDRKMEINRGRPYKYGTPEAVV